MVRSRTGGFSLIEMLLVIAIILILYVMMYGPAQKSYQDKRKIDCQKNLQLLHMALRMYAADYRDSFPVVAGAATSELPLSLLVPRYTAETRIFVCPGSADRRLPEAQPFTDRKISYAYYMGHGANDGTNEMLITDEQIDTRPRGTGQQMFSPNGKRPGNNHRKFGGNVLFCDGHVEECPPVAARDLAFSNNVILLNPKP